MNIVYVDCHRGHFTHFPDKDRMCFLSEKSHRLSLSYWWYCTHGILGELGYFYVLYGAIEFICSQSPYSMKGLLIGFTYFIFGLSILFTLCCCCLCFSLWTTGTLFRMVVGCGSTCV